MIYVLEVLRGYHLVLLVIGCLFLVAELFIPGIGVAGVLGTLLLVISIGIALFDPMIAWTELLVSFVVLAAYGAIALYLIKRRKLWERMILVDQQNPKRKDESVQVDIGDIGEAKTILRPAGAAMFGNQLVDVLSEGMFIPVGAKIEVIRLEGQKVIVRQRRENN